MIYMYKSTSGPLVSDTFSCLYRGQPFYVLKITFTVYYKMLGIPVLILIVVMSSEYKVINEEMTIVDSHRFI